jgi:hypothetical protein
MTRKDYVALADALLSARNECKELAEVRGVNWAVFYIGDKLAADNARFDRERFIAACEGRPVGWTREQWAVMKEGGK